MMTDDTLTPVDENTVAAEQPENVDASAPTPAEEPTTPTSEPTVATAPEELTNPTPEPEEPAAAPEPAEVPEAPVAEAPSAEAEPAAMVADAPAEVPVQEATPEVVETAVATEEKAAPVVDRPGEMVAEAPAAKMDDDALFQKYLDDFESGEESQDGSGGGGGYKKLSRGDRVEATVIQVDNDRVFVDLGTKSEGIIPLSELTDEGGVPSDHVKAGDKIQVVVIKTEGAEGNPVVSKKRADFEDLWDTIEQAMHDKKTLHAQVVDRVKGGLLVDIGVRGFVPATHVGNGKLRNIEKYVGQSIPLKILEIDRERKKVVLSNREADAELRASAKDELFSNVNVGDTLEGTVRRLTDYGAFVDLGGVDGLLHISEMSWARINHPREMFKEGQKIQVMVLRLDSGNGKISLGHRQVLPDPWNLIRENYTVNQRFMTKITRLVVSGAFVRLPEGAEAFIPLSEMSNRRIRKPEEAVDENQEVEVQIIDLRPDERRMVLSLRATGSNTDAGRTSTSAPSSYGDDDDRGKKKGGKGGKKGGKGRGRGDDDYDDIVGRRGFATGGATIGERLGMLKGLLSRDEDDDADETPAVEADAGEEAAETADES